MVMMPGTQPRTLCIQSRQSDSNQFHPLTWEGALTRETTTEP